MNLVPMVMPLSDDFRRKGIGTRSELKAGQPWGGGGRHVSAGGDLQTERGHPTLVQRMTGLAESGCSVHWHRERREVGGVSAGVRGYANKQLQSVELTDEGRLEIRLVWQPRPIVRDVPKQRGLKVVSVDDHVDCIND